jgi:predicted nicotinamide N-methyase
VITATLPLKSMGFLARYLSLATLARSHWLASPHARRLRMPEWRGMGLGFTALVSGRRLWCSGGMHPPDFIRANTRLLPVPLVPEIRLHLAEESLPLWQKTEEELGEMNVPPPYWAFAWAGGQALARHLLDTPALVAGRRVLDLGAGSGLSGIAAKRAGAAHVLAADIDQLALAAIRLNAAANGATIDTTPDDLLDTSRAKSDSFEVILVGHLFYERALAERVLAFIETARTGGAEILVGDPRRSYFPIDRFHQVAEYRVPVTRELEDAEIKRTAVWQLAAGA